MNVGRFSQRAIAVAALLTLGLTTACRDTTGHDDEEPNIASVHITANPGTAGASTVIINIGAGQTPGPLTLMANQDNEVVVRFLDPTGSDDAVVSEHREDYELRFESLGGIVYTSLPGFPMRGTLRPTTLGAATIRLVLFNTEHAHSEVTRDLVVNVVAP
jgi:hypothetical protein